MKSNIINRRNFLAQSGMAAAAALFSPSAFATLAKPRFKMGLQLYTIREAMEKDVAGTLKRIASLDYQDVETYGFDPAGIGYYGRRAKDFHQLLKDNGLTTASGHYDLFKYLHSPDDVLLTYVDQCIEGAQQLDQKYITWPWLAPEDRNIDQFKLLASRLNIIGARVKKAGLGFAYHNHDFEFVDHGGINGYQIIMKETDPDLVKLQMDMYWVVRAAKKQPVEFFRQQPGRFVMWHIKDMDRTTEDYTELGRGVIDYTKILPDVNLAGMQYYFLEQGGNFRTGNAMDSITENADFCKRKLRKFL
ncbi:sugar phosphate isomerase/epimerase family protein [Chitinophaga qingshengii]|uniref:Sugar phosphate isomerase/epimerase n=1 Tax=Chitinophaga qingshengii TaxID=1569794 RepID=A0ABR7TRS4_9BACT|nr:sugar phosphate isomerase/epimerase [Chitinophaga qingshengii]MBC9932715.1 sugar phosphate isomerase/epimerase [Chitinophaga qingshengii]